MNGTVIQVYTDTRGYRAFYQLFHIPQIGIGKLRPTVLIHKLAVVAVDVDTGTEVVKVAGDLIGGYTPKSRAVSPADHVCPPRLGLALNPLQD